MTISPPTVSVVVPCYNYGRYLESCVGSILKQDGVEVRILIIDDGSSDNSFAVAQRLASQYSQVEVRRHEVNCGHISTYNEGLLDWAKGEYSVLISADDLLVPGALARAVGVMERHSNVGFVYGHAINWVDDLPLPKARTNMKGVRLWKGHDWVRTVCRLGHNIITSPEVVVRTVIQREAGGYRSSLPHSGDLEMWLRLAARSDVAFIEGADQAYYRIHAANMTLERSPVIDLAQRAAAFDSFFEDSGHLLCDNEKLHESARRQIAREALWRARRAYEARRLAKTPVVELKQLACTIYRASNRLPEYRALRLRELVGPNISPFLQIFVLSAINRKLRSFFWSRRWRRKGY